MQVYLRDVGETGDGRADEEGAKRLTNLITPIGEPYSKYTGVRISQMSQDTVEIFKQFLESEGYSQGVFMVLEKQGTPNAHYHVILREQEHSEAYSKRCKRFFAKCNEAYKDVGRGGKRKIWLGSYPIDDIHDKGYMYLCKGAGRGQLPLVMMNNLLTQQDIIDYHHAEWDKREGRVITSETKSSNAHVVVHEVQPRPKKPNEDKRFLDWFNENKLWQYKHDDIYIFQGAQMVGDIEEFYKLHTKSYRRYVIEQKLNLLYNNVVREYDPDEFRVYHNYMVNEMKRIFTFW